MLIRFCLNSILLIAISVNITGCLESSFNLAQESRLPIWFEIPEGMSRDDLIVTMDYYSTFSGAEAVFKLYKKDGFFNLKKVSGIPHGPLKLKNPPPGFPKHYPSYEVITVDGVTDIIEHRKMEPVFYVTDNPAIWKEFGVENAIK